MATEKRRLCVRRSFTGEFKTGAARLVIDEGTSVGQAACELDLTESALPVSAERLEHCDAPAGRLDVSLQAA